jgi:hypothetical protein
MEAAILAAARDLPPGFLLCYRKTGLWAPRTRAFGRREHQGMETYVDEYRAIQAASARPDNPKLVCRSPSC